LFGVYPVKSNPAREVLMLILAVTSTPTNGSGGPSNPVIGIMIFAVVIIIFAVFAYSKFKK
jgi:hypothetical protein